LVAKNAPAAPKISEPKQLEATQKLVAVNIIGVTKKIAKKRKNTILKVNLAKTAKIHKTSTEVPS